MKNEYRKDGVITISGKKRSDIKQFTGGQVLADGRITLPTAKGRKFLLNKELVEKLGIDSIDASDGNAPDKIYYRLGKNSNGKEISIAYPKLN